MGSFEAAVAESAWRESAAFDVTIADYRRAFALGVASDRRPAPPFWPIFRQAAWRLWRWALAFAIFGGLAWLGYRYDPDEPIRGLAWEALVLAGHVLLPVTPVVLLMAGAQAWNLSRWRRGFPERQAAWKRPARMRVRWNDAALVRAGTHGFGSFAWAGLHSWIDAPDELVVFTAMLDPIPIPHAALTAGDLADLRVRLAGAEVPDVWMAMSARQQGLLRVFR